MIKKIGIVLGIGAILLALLVAGMVAPVDPSEETLSGRVLSLETQRIETLYPHGHTVGQDAVGDAGHHVYVQSKHLIADKDMWITGIAYDIKGAPAVTLHHGSVFDLSKQNLECPSEGPLTLVTVSQDQRHTSQAHFKEGYGIFIEKGTPLMLDAMFHNPNKPVGPGEIYTDVSLKVDLFLAAEGQTDLRPLESRLLQLSDAPCMPRLAHTFSVPGRALEYSFAGTSLANDTSRLVITKPSRIVYWGAHLHGWEGGKSLTVKKNGEILEVFTTAKDEADGYRYDTPHGNADILLEPGDLLSLEALYSNMSTSPIREAMGQLGLYIAEE